MVRARRQSDGSPLFRFATDSAAFFYRDPFDVKHGNTKTEGAEFKP